MSLPYYLPTTYSDAADWPDQVSVKFEAKPSKHDEFPVTGSAEFTYTRLRLREVATAKKFVKLPYQFQALEGGKVGDPLYQKFMALRLGIGKPAAWFAVFGGQPPKQKAFVQKFTGGGDNVIYTDCPCSLSLDTCPLLSPKRRGYPRAGFDRSSTGSLYGLGPGFEADQAVPGTSTVQLVQRPMRVIEEGQQEDVVLPVYRVSLPMDEAVGVSELTLLVDGVEHSVSGSPTYFEGQLPYLLRSLLGVTARTIVQRSPGICEVELATRQATLGSGKVTCWSQKPIKGMRIIASSILPMHGTIEAPIPIIGQSIPLTSDFQTFYNITGRVNF